MVMLLLASAGMKAQEKKWEHQVFISSGILFNRDDGSSETGLSAQLGYGLNHFLSEKFSLMPGIVLRYASDNGFKRSLEGADDDNFFFADIPLMALYHVSVRYRTNQRIRKERKCSDYQLFTTILHFLMFC